MAQFSISGYDNDSKCKICGAHVSERHYAGCELGAVYSEIKEARLVIKQFLKLLGVETITSALSKIAAEQSVQRIGLEPGVHKVQCSHCCKITEFEVPNRPTTNANR